MSSFVVMWTLMVAAMLERRWPVWICDLVCL
jgi:hypothetical protein